MASQSLLQALSLLLVVVALSHAQTTSQNQVTISKLESQSSLSSYVITLQCSIDNAVQGNRSFYRKVDNMTQRVVVGGVENSVRVTFELTPDVEGYYYCQAGNVSSNRLLVVSYPVLDLSISSTRLAPVAISDTITVPCAYPRGRFANRYSVTWFKGLVEVDLDVAQFDRYLIQQDFSLVIRSVVPDDASDAYYCQVRVNVANGSTVVKTAPFINVNVLDPLMVRQHLAEEIIMPGRTATFTCEIGGAPEPTVRWTFNGQQLDITSIPSRQSLRNVLAVSHTIRLNSSLGSGQVTCVAYHTVGGQLAVVSSEAHLIVLTDKLEPTLSVTTEGPRLNVRFPSIIPGQFDLVVYYQHLGSSRLSNQLISHPSFRNTREIDIAIPFDKLPSFKTFSVSVALSVANMTGGSSSLSNEITIGEYPNVTITDCSCPDPAASQSEPVIVAFLAVFVVLSVVACVIVMIVLYLSYKKKKYTIKEDTYDNEGGHFSSEEHEMSKISKSPPYESPRLTGRKGSVSSHGSDGGDESSDDEGDATGGTHHKKLQQWDEKLKVPEDAEVVDDETGMRMQSREYEPPHPAPRVDYRPPMGRGCVTNIPKPRTTRKTEAPPKMKPSDSTSSFEDLEEESREFKGDAPRTM